METKDYTSRTCFARLRAVTPALVMGPVADLARLELVHASQASRRSAVSAVAGNGGHQGTALSTIVPTTEKTTVSLPSTDVVVFDGAAGIRSWSPPV